jgi:hypothetical protein
MTSPLPSLFALVTLFAAIKQPAFGQSTTTVESLDRLVARGLLAEANFSLHQLKDLSPPLFQWLKVKAETGTPPFQYEYGFRLLPTDPVLAKRWYARAYLARSLDFAECMDRGRNVIHMAIGTIYGPVQEEALKNRPAYAEELESAILWESARVSKPDSEWLCPGQQLQAEKRGQARAAQLAAIKESIDRLRAAPR